MCCAGYGRLRGIQANRGELFNRMDKSLLQAPLTSQTPLAPYYLITGGTPLYGEVRVSGAKNAVTKMMMASLLTTETCMLRNVPLIGDLDLTVKLCESLGSQVQLTDHTLNIHTDNINK